MGWGTYYKHDGYLSHIGKNEIENKREECLRINDMLWREILAYMASTPPAMMKSDEGIEYPWQEFIAMKIRDFRDEIEDNARLMTHLDDCIEAMEENPENVTEG